MSKPAYDRADASALLDDRGYSGLLIRGQNPALLFEKGVRERITESYYWKEQCFGLNAATLCDRAVELKFIGGTSGITGRPTPFLCLAFKMLQLVPEKKIVLEMLNFRDDEEEDGVKAEEVKEEEWKLRTKIRCPPAPSRRTRRVIAAMSLPSGERVMRSAQRERASARRSGAPRPPGAAAAR